VAAVLEGVRDHSGTAILLTEHDVPFVRRLATRLYVLDAGRLLADGPTDEVLADPDVRLAYLGVGT
jgi:branched-chain amino acid transport system ATP-binding protein